MKTLSFLVQRIRRHGVKTSLVLACLGLVLTAWTVEMPTPALAATTTPTAPTSCAAYQVIPHGFATLATTTCLAHTGAVVKPFLYDCHGGHLVIYQDANYGGAGLCLGPGDYNLTNLQFCAFWPFGCGTANDQLSSFTNDTADWGYMTTDINGYGDVLYFSGYQATPFVGAFYNDQISFIHLS